METTVRFTHTGGRHCEAQLPNGALPIDPAVQRGQPGAGPSPLDLLALAHGSCMAMMMAKTAQQHGWDLAGMTVEVTHQFGAQPPTELLRASVRFCLPRAFAPAELAELRAGAETCPVHCSLRAPVEVVLECPTNPQPKE